MYNKLGGRKFNIIREDTCRLKSNFVSKTPCDMEKVTKFGIIYTNF